MSVFDIFKKRNNEQYHLVPDKDIQGNQVTQALLNENTLKRRQTVKEMIERLDKSWNNCFYQGEFNKYATEDPSIFLEVLGNIKPKNTFNYDENWLKSTTLLEYIMFFNNSRMWDASRSNLHTIIKYIVQNVKKIPSSMHIIYLCHYKFPDKFVEEMIQYFDINTTNTKNQNVLFYVNSIGSFKAVYDKNKTKINLKQKDNNDCNFIQHYIKKNNDCLTNEYFIKELTEFNKLRVNFNAVNKDGYSILNMAIDYNRIDFVLELSKLDFIDFTIDVNNPKNWFKLLVGYDCFTLNQKITILKNINAINKLEPKALLEFYDIHFHIFGYSRLYDDILILIEHFILGYKEQMYKQFFEYTDDKGNTIIHRLASIRHKTALRFIIDHTDIKFVKNGYGEYPIDVYKENKLESLMEHNV